MNDLIRKISRSFIGKEKHIRVIRPAVNKKLIESSNKTGWLVPKRNAIAISNKIIDISSMNQKKIKLYKIMLEKG